MPDPTFVNLGFELAGAAPGLAAGWTLAFQASAEEVAGYAPAPERAQEDFSGGWLGNESFVFALTQAVVEPALYDEAPESIEDFEEGWSNNESFLRELTSAAAADYEPGAGLKLAEDFETQWASNESLERALGPANLAETPAETFEEEWRGNELFLFALQSADLTKAVYDGGGTQEPAERFEGGWPTLVMTTV
jgi:hypothetical protein